LDRIGLRWWLKFEKGRLGLLVHNWLLIGHSVRSWWLEWLEERLHCSWLLELLPLLQ
jgi:hypothetical protein